MKGKLAFVFCLLLLMSCLAFAKSGQPETKASSTLPVHNLSTGLNYSTIQDAIDANETLDGQTILVDAGTYYENVVVNKSISLIGTGSGSTIIDANGTGSPVELSNNVTLSGFTLRNGGDGIDAEGCENCYISDNQMINNTFGINLECSVADPTLSVITQNYIANSSTGIWADEAYNTTFTENMIVNSSDRGINLFASMYNTFFNNNFINNSIQVFNWGESGEWPNTWDNGNSSGGNYWSNYNGNNTNNDGFGNIPYNVGPYEVGNLDHYPLLGMFNSFNVTPQYSVETVSNSTISDFQFNGTTIAFNASDENGTAGFCRISIPTALVNGTIAVSVNGTEVPYILLPESNSTQSILYLTYHNSVVVNGPIFIQENGSVEPISAPIQRNGSIYTLTGDVASFSDGIVIEIDGITLDGAGHTVQGMVNSSAPSANETTGINLTGQSNVTIENTNVMGFTDGIMLSASNNLENVSDFNTIVGNNLTSDGNGIILAPSNGSEILSNDISDNGVGISVSDFSMNNSIGTNTLTGNPLGIFLNDSENNYVYANRVSSMYDSIWLDGSSNNSLTQNTVSTAYYGNGIILLDSSNYNAIVGNDVTNCDEGLSLRSSSNFGIIVGNTIEGNFRGLENIGSSNDTIARNDISNSGWFNFRLSGCSGDLVYENSITGNAISIWLASSSNNSIYHNFIGSMDVTLVAPNSNTWDDGYPSGGNYWVGANLTDRFSGAYQNITGSDGICDSPVVLNANNTDRYPLAGSFYSFNATSEQYVQILSNSTISNFGFNGTAILFDMTGENGTDGFCRISIPLGMMNGPFSVFVNGTQVTYTLIPNSNDSLSYLYFSLHFSTQEITVIPEYSAGMVAISLMLVALAVLVYKKRH